MNGVDTTGTADVNEGDTTARSAGGDNALASTRGTSASGASRVISTVARRLGKILVVAGLIVLVHAAYQLWGTGVQQSKAQSLLGDEFVGLLAEHQVVSSGADVEKSSPATSVRTRVQAESGQRSPSQLSSDSADENDGPTDEDPDVENLVPAGLLDFDEGSVLGRLSIPAIDVEQLIVEGIEEGSLQQGPGHYPSTSLPGLAGNAAIAGHRTTWGAPFNRIDELEPGDRIQVEMVWGTFTYEVVAQGEDESSGHMIVEPSDVWVLDDAGDNRLTLTSCHPLYSARERIIVTARLVGEPANVEFSV